MFTHLVVSERGSLQIWIPVSFACWETCVFRWAKQSVHDMESPGMAACNLCSHHCWIKHKDEALPLSLPYLMQCQEMINTHYPTRGPQNSTVQKSIFTPSNPALGQSWEESQMQTNTCHGATSGALIAFLHFTRYYHVGGRQLGKTLIPAFISSNALALTHFLYPPVSHVKLPLRRLELYSFCFIVQNSLVLPVWIPH